MVSKVSNRRPGALAEYLDEPSSTMCPNCGAGLFYFTNKHPHYWWPTRPYGEQTGCKGCGWTSEENIEIENLVDLTIPKAAAFVLLGFIAAAAVFFLLVVVTS